MMGGRWGWSPRTWSPGPPGAAGPLAEQVAATGYGAHPIRLSGRTMHVDRATGEVREVYDSAEEPDAVLLTACGNRRESRCPPGAAVDRADAFQLVWAGLDGGKGVPASIAGHPRLFVTFTAPGFGPVPACQQQRGKRRPCRPRDRDKRWPHGRRVGCWVRHRPDDPALGSPLCLDCLTPRAWSWGTPWPPSSGGAPPATCAGAGRRGRPHPAGLEGSRRPSLRALSGCG
jgi:hypothetical protein